MHKRILNSILAITLILITIFTITGCSSSDVAKDEVINAVKQAFDNAEYCEKISVLDNKNNVDITKYSFKNDKFNFAVIKREDETGKKEYETDYLQNLLKYYGDNLDKTSQKYAITVEHEETDNYIVLKTQIDKLEDAEKISTGVFELYKTIENHLPVVCNKIFDFELRTIVNSANKNDIQVTVASPFFSLYRNSINKETVSKYIRYFYINAVKENKVEDNNVTTEIINEIKPFEIKDLYINDKKFETMSNFSFIYNVEDDCYYATIDFDNTPSDMEIGVEMISFDNTKENLHKQIIESIYENSDYKIITTSLITYNINGTKYEIRRSTDGSIVVFKTNKEMLIKGYGTINTKSFGKYESYLKVEDFAKTVGLGVEKIDIENGVIYLSAAKFYENEVIQL